MSNSENANDPRLKQDKIERKDNENSSAGMIGGVVVVLIAIVGLYILYTYEVAPASTPINVSQPTATVNTAIPAKPANPVAPANPAVPANAETPATNPQSSVNPGNPASTTNQNTGVSPANNSDNS